LGHPVEIDQVLLHQDGHTVGEQLIQEVEVRNAKVSQGVIVDLNSATEPAEAGVIGAQPGHLPGAADALNSGL
jgi:hypothetical protein